MVWTGLNELREKFLRFFEEKGHTILPSAPLVPQGDNSLLLINSGMAPLKKYFLGLETPPNKRVTTCQKCIRTPDIERVGKTSRHGTYFEMLGNFSFGDYFKEDATKWAWEFITQVLEIPQDKLWVSIYEEDDEAFTIWTERRGVPAGRIVRLGKEDNFWEIGTGPCGPCSEIYFDRGEEAGCGSPDCAVGCDCDRYVEFWNLVFTQFNSDGKGAYTPLEHPNIDTGMGLERLACIMQGVDNLFEVDTVARIMEHVCSIAGTAYKKDAQADVSLRVVTDHIRSTVFMVGDGVVPQNEGRGYVLRRLLRRAARHGRLLGINEPFLYKVCDTVIEENKSAYPQLAADADYIRKVIRVEEERFDRTINQGFAMVSEMIERLENRSFKQGGPLRLGGEQAFKLYDTFGFPIDLTREILEERGIGLDEEGFLKYMEEQRRRARAARLQAGSVGWEEDVLSALENNEVFVGYDHFKTDGEVLSLVVDGQITEELDEGREGVVILSRTPFYAESGGQVGDTGEIISGDSLFRVTDCKKSPTGHVMHIGRMEKGGLSVGSQARGKVDKERRRAIMRNHTAAHLLQKALRTALGDHVHQAGQLVDDSVCRFDFTHFSAMTREEIGQVENEVNRMILECREVSAEEMPLDEARSRGAMALFSEKYGDRVRVVSVAGESMELCGGTHVRNTAQLGLFKILRESSVAAGVRRIEAVTGRGVLDLMESREHLLDRMCAALKVGNPGELEAKIAAVTADLKEKEREIGRLHQQLADLRADELLENMPQIGPVRLVRVSINDASPDILKDMGTRLVSENDDVAGLLASINGEKATLLAVSGKAAREAGIQAGKLVKEAAALIGGSGGGKPDLAMGGTAQVDRVDEMMASLPAIVEKMLGIR